MGMKIVFTLTGTDRIGIVDEITNSLLELGVNIEASRMARLGGEFAILMLMELPTGSKEALDRTVSDLSLQGYKITTTETSQTAALPRTNWLPYHIEVEGADHEGVFHHLVHILSEHGISIENADTGTTRAPNSGIPLFSMRALILVPPHADEHAWQHALEMEAQEQHVDVSIAAAPAA